MQQVMPMYNRYIPQADGSYRRSRVPDACPPHAPPPTKPPASQPEPPCQPKCESPRPKPCKDKPPISKQDCNAISFLKQLLPKSFDTGDLLIVLLLLIMAGDDDKNTALLTLALYFLM